MKHLFLPFFVLVFLMGLVFQTQAQVTISIEDFQREASFVDSLYADYAETISLPTEGLAQEWDYSGLEREQFFTVDYTDAQGDEDFPDALNYARNDLFFLDLPIENYDYDAVNDTGWFAIGRRIVETAFPLTSLTGGMNDTIRFLDTTYRYDNSLAYLKFPMSYGDQWSVTRNGFTPFTATIQAFDLNETPGKSSSHLTLAREVVGYGTVILPGLDGLPTPPIEVLLVKSVATYIDSVFLNGAPAPPAILGPFGLTQGNVREEFRYLMYTPGFSKPVMNFGFTAENEIIFAAFRPQVAETITAVRNIGTFATTQFPNPIAAGETLTIQTEIPLTSGFVQLIDTQGKILHQLPFAAAGVANQFQVQLPNNLPVGLYFYEVQDKQAKRVGYGKLLVH